MMPSATIIVGLAVTIMFKADGSATVLGGSLLTLKDRDVNNPKKEKQMEVVTFGRIRLFRKRVKEDSGYWVVEVMTPITILAIVILPMAACSKWPSPW